MPAGAVGVVRVHRVRDARAVSDDATVRAARADVLLVLDQLLGHALVQVRVARAEPRDAVDDVLIVEALEDKLAPQAKWPPELVKLLSASVDLDVDAAARAMERAIERGRRSRKRPPRL